MDLTNLPLWASLLLLLGLVARVTRLVTTDTLTQPLRSKLHVFAIKDRTYGAEKQDYVGGKLCQKVAYFFWKLTHCDWCTSVWVAAVAVAGASAYSDKQWWNVVALVASLSYVVSWVSDKNYEE